MIERADGLVSAMPPLDEKTASNFLSATGSETSQEIVSEGDITFEKTLSPEVAPAVANEDGGVAAPAIFDESLLDDNVLYDDKPNDLENVVAEAAPGPSTRRTRKDRAVKVAAPARRSSVGPALFFAFAMVTLVAVLAHGLVTRLVPGAGKIYSALGLGGKSQPLAIKLVSSEIGRQGEGEFLVVEGEIENRGRGESTVPAIRLAVRDDAGIDLYSWDIQSPRERLAPGEKAVFRARLASPPKEAKSISSGFGTGKLDGLNIIPGSGSPVSNLSIRGKNT